MRKYGISKDYLLYTGVWRGHKNLVNLIRAFALGLPTKKLHIIGDGPERASLESLVRELDLDGRVLFHGALYGSALDREVLSAEALVVPSIWYENLPYVVTENQARGVVVIASQSGGIAERIEHGVNGLLFPIGSSKALYQALEQLDALDLGALRQKAKQSASDLTPEIFLERIDTVYRELLDHKKK
jgi:glycosyltransferase involved in cell wall biosynthesis